MTIHIIQHAPFEEPGIILQWASNHSYSVSITKVYKNEKLPQVDSFDMLVIMGGPMGVYDELEYPWLKDEKELIKASIETNKKVLGVCLGSQLLANVLGAKVFQNKEKEIGFWPINVTSNSNGFLKGFPEQSVVFHWHGDTFDLPRDAVLLASSEACRNQAFSIGKNILALQFHIEVTTDLIENFLKYGKDELIEKPYIQDEERIRTGYQYLPTSQLLMEELLDRFVKE